MTIRVFSIILLYLFQFSSSNFDYTYVYDMICQDSIPFDSTVSIASFEYKDYKGVQGFYRWVQDRVDPIYYTGGLDSKRIVIEFDVSKKGKIKNIRIVNLLTIKERWRILKVLKSAPHWTPATKAGQEIDMHFTMPLYIKK